MSMRIKERISALVLGAVFTFSFLYSLAFPDIPSIMPKYFSLGGALLCAALFIRTFFLQYGGESAEAKGVEKRTIVLLAGAIAALTVYIVLITVVGYYVTTFAFIVVMARMIDPNRKLWQYPVVSLGVLVLIYLIFSMFLSVPLPKGILL